MAKTRKQFDYYEPEFVAVSELEGYGLLPQEIEVLVNTLEVTTAVNLQYDTANTCFVLETAPIEGSGFYLVAKAYTLSETISRFLRNMASKVTDSVEAQETAAQLYKDLYRFSEVVDELPTNRHYVGQLVDDSLAILVKGSQGHFIRYPDKKILHPTEIATVCLLPMTKKSPKLPSSKLQPIPAQPWYRYPLNAPPTGVLVFVKTDHNSKTQPILAWIDDSKSLNVMEFNGYKAHTFDYNEIVEWMFADFHLWEEFNDLRPST